MNIASSTALGIALELGTFSYALSPLTSNSNKDCKQDTLAAQDIFLIPIRGDYCRDNSNIFRAIEQLKDIISRNSYSDITLKEEHFATIKLEIDNLLTDLESSLFKERETATKQILSIAFSAPNSSVEYLNSKINHKLTLPETKARLSNICTYITELSQEDLKNEAAYAAIPFLLDYSLVSNIKNRIEISSDLEPSFEVAIKLWREAREECVSMIPSIIEQFKPERGALGAIPDQDLPQSFKEAKKKYDQAENYIIARVQSACLNFGLMAVENPCFSLARELQNYEGMLAIVIDANHPLSCQNRLSITIPLNGECSFKQYNNLTTTKLNEEHLAFSLQNKNGFIHKFQLSTLPQILDSNSQVTLSFGWDYKKNDRSAFYLQSIGASTELYQSVLGRYIEVEGSEQPILP